MRQNCFNEANLVSFASGHHRLHYFLMPIYVTIHVFAGAGISIILSPVSPESARTRKWKDEE